MRMTTLRSTPVFLLSLSLSLAFAAGCDDDDEGVDSDEEARRAYLGLDASIEKALNLGMDGYNAADNANIPDQESVGEVDGVIVVSGQVDAGTSDNKEMRLYISLADYTDGPIVIEDANGEEETIEIDITYDTYPDDLPYLELSLRDIPDGTFTGTLTGTYAMDGDIDGDVTLTLSMTGEIEDDGDGGITRVVGTTDVTGTATNPGGGQYDVDVTL